MVQAVAGAASRGDRHLRELPEPIPRHGRRARSPRTYRWLPADHGCCGEILADRLDPARTPSISPRRGEPGATSSRVYYLPLGYPAGNVPRRATGASEYRPTAAIRHVPRKSWPRYRTFASGPQLSSFFYHYARLIEILYAIETIERILRDPEILNPHVRAIAQPNTLRRRGRCEAPRGTLMHHYRIDENGLITWANLIIATGITISR